MLKRFFALTTLFFIYIFPSSATANINTIELNYEKVGMPKEEIKNSSKDNSSGLISKKTGESNPKKKENGFLKFLGLLVLSYALMEILDSDSSSTSTSTSSSSSSQEQETDEIRRIILIAN